MEHNCFEFEDSFYSQCEWTSMGNSLSPFIVNLFMSRFEIEISCEAGYFLRLWLSYVDDVFVIFDSTVCSVDDFLMK